MDKMLINLFGFNKLNLWGWIVAGLMVAAVFLYLLVQSIQAAPNWHNQPQLMLLAAIALVVVAIFCLLLSLYCSLVAEKLEKAERDRYEDDRSRER